MRGDVEAGARLVAEEEGMEMERWNGLGGREDPRSPKGAKILRNKSSITSTGGELALFEEKEGEGSAPLAASYLAAFTIPGPVEREKSDTKKTTANMGVLIGVYLPTIQHIFGVLMFLRLFWIVGSMGILQSFFMVALCCLCTFLTSISMSAIATNGVVESGGSYFMISRNLGPEFGTAVGVLFYLANTVATAMYLVGGVEIALMYIAPSLTIGGGPEIHDDTSPGGMMAHNFRLYASILLVVEMIIVAVGVRFVQLFAPLSLCCVIVSILSIYAGAVHKAMDPTAGPEVCLLGDRLLKREAYVPSSLSDYNASRDGSLCAAFCRRDSPLLRSHYCAANGTCYKQFQGKETRCLQSMPGFASGVFMDNMHSKYMKVGEALPGQKAKREYEVFQDYKTSFFKLLAIYFPSVTGIMTGSNMSGDLRDPQQSIPSGTIAAQLTTTFVYLSFVLVFGGTIEGPLLRDKYGNSLGSGMVVAELAWPSRWVLLIGSFTSTFGAALQCICSAPRLLQSIAKDDVIPFLRPFAVVDSRNEPIRGLLISTFIAELAILIGAVDYIAPIVDLFFLMCYAFVNAVCALHSILGAPNWRPRFRFYHWTLSLLGAGLCLFIMLATYWYYAIVAILLCGLIYKYVEYKGAKKEWGDGMRGLALTTAQYSLLKIEDKDPHPKNWRPQILILMKLDGDLKPQYRKMFELASQLKAGKGLTMVASLLQGDPTNLEDRAKATRIKDSLKTEMGLAKLKGFAKTVVYEKDHMASSISTLVQTAGIGGLKPNTILVGWPTSWKTEDKSGDTQYWDFMDKIHRGASQDMCLIVPKGIQDFPDKAERLNGTMDVWWILHDGGLLILLSFLLNQHKVWRGCGLRLFAVAQAEDNSIKMKADMEAFLYQLRIPAQVHVVELAEPEISAYAYERTLLMEERSQLIRHLHLSTKEKKQLPQLLVEKHRGSHSGRGASDPNVRDSSELQQQQTAPSSLLRVEAEAEAEGGEGKAPLARPEHSTPEHTPASAASSSTLLVPPERRGPWQQGTSSTTAAANDAASSSGDDVEDPVAEDRDRLSSLKKSADTASSHKKYEYTFTPAEARAAMAGGGSSGAETPTTPPTTPEIRLPKLDRRKVKKMHTAVRLNNQIRETSGKAELVVLNLPRPPRSRLALHNYVEYLEALTDQLPRVLLVRGSGKEVITIYS